VFPVEDEGGARTSCPRNSGQTLETLMTAAATRVGEGFANSGISAEARFEFHGQETAFSHTALISTSASPIRAAPTDIATPSGTVNSENCATRRPPAPRIV